MMVALALASALSSFPVALHRSGLPHLGELVCRCMISHDFAAVLALFGRRRLGSLAAALGLGGCPRFGTALLVVLLAFGAGFGLRWALSGSPSWAEFGIGQHHDGEPPGT